MMRLLGSNENKISKDESKENVTYLEFTELILVHCRIVNNFHWYDSLIRTERNSLNIKLCNSQFKKSKSGIKMALK